MDQNPANSYNTETIDSRQFNEMYWFNSLQMVTVINPKSEDYPFMVEMRHFIVRSGAQERFPGVIANVYLDQMSKILAQDNDQLGYMTDPNLRRKYYDDLIVDVENLAPEYNPSPAWARSVAPSAIHEPSPVPDDTPPWQQNMERARDVAPNVAPQAPQQAPPEPATAGNSQPPNQADTVEERDQQFEYDGAVYRMVVSKDDKQMFYKNGKLCSAADYEKAASLL